MPVACAGNRLPQSAPGFQRTAFRQAPSGDLSAHVRPILRHCGLPGGGLYVLSDPFGCNPRLRDVLADSVVAMGVWPDSSLAAARLDTGTLLRRDGNLSGEETVGGSFLSPDLSYDGRTVVFAYVECTGDRHHAHHTDPSRGHWADGRCYHVFRVNVDGSNLVQLTDGTWNDFDPRGCQAAGSRLFPSGGAATCGAAAYARPTRCMIWPPTAATFAASARTRRTSGIPSVTHDGRIAWTRWDYVDRHFSAAHMPWITTVDGCDPRPIHGNYAWRGSRPDMELNLRAVPDSPKFVATAAPHHGQAFGSFVVIDPRVATTTADRL